MKTRRMAQSLMSIKLELFAVSADLAVVLTVKKLLEKVWKRLLWAVAEF